MQNTILEKKNLAKFLQEAANIARQAIEKNYTCANDAELDAFYKRNDRIHFMFVDQYTNFKNVDQIF